LLLVGLLGIVAGGGQAVGYLVLDLRDLGSFGLGAERPVPLVDGLDLRPDDGYIIDSLGWAYFRLNRFDDAVDELERAAQIKAGDATINDHLGDAYWRVGRKLEA
ncbi:tetratricopeptide repeat protein, partial [Rhizobium ruizarguesonis]